MACAQALCNERRTGEVRAQRFERIARCRDRLKVKAVFTMRVLPMGALTELLSGPWQAVTVRRLWTGAEAQNVILKSMTRPCSQQGAGRGTERTNGCTGR